MKDIVVGGSGFCRLCGKSHSWAMRCHEEPSWMQKVQMAIEKAEGFCKRIGFKAGDIKKIEDRFKVMRKELRVPDDPIYTTDYLSATDSGKKAKAEHIAKAKTERKEIENMVFAKAVMNDAQRKEHKEIFSELVKALQ